MCICVAREKMKEKYKKQRRFDGGGDAIQCIANIKPHITNNEYITINKVINNNQMLRLSLYFKLIFPRYAHADASYSALSLAALRILDFCVFSIALVKKICHLRLKKEYRKNVCIETTSPSHHI